MDPFLMSICENICKEQKELFENKTVLEVGSQNINGSFRGDIEKCNPKKYIGVDIEKGEGVDEICNIYELYERFNEPFDIVVCTEVIEHCEDWRAAINQLKLSVKKDGILLLTSRSKGFGIHSYPSDYWRFEIEDIELIFNNWEINKLCKDEYLNTHFGFFLMAKRINIELSDLSKIALYNIYTDPRHNPENSKLKRTLN